LKDYAEVNKLLKNASKGGSLKKKELIDIVSKHCQTLLWNLLI